MTAGEHRRSVLEPLQQLESLAVQLGLRMGPDALIREADDGSGWVVRMGRGGEPGFLNIGGWTSLDGKLHPTERAARIAARTWLQEATEHMGIAGAIMCGRNRA